MEAVSATQESVNRVYHNRLQVRDEAPYLRCSDDTKSTVAYRTPDYPGRFYDLLAIGQEDFCRYLWSPRLKEKAWQAIGQRQSGKPVTDLLKFKVAAEAWVPERHGKFCSVDCYVSPNQFFDWRNTKQLAKLHANWVEIDTREHAIVTEADQSQILTEVFAQLESADLPFPTAYVFSGSGGLHLYWIYEGVPAFHWRKSAWKHVAERLCDSFIGGRLWAVDYGASKDPARVLRMVGSIHGRSGRSVECQIGGPLYSFESLAKCLGVACFEPVSIKSPPIPLDAQTSTECAPTIAVPVVVPMVKPIPPKVKPVSPATEQSLHGKGHKHSIRGWWFRIYTQIVSELRKAPTPVPEGRRDNTAYILFVALRHMMADAEEALERVKEINAELIHLAEKDLVQYLSTAGKTLYHYRKETLAAFLEQQVGIKADFLYKPPTAPLSNEEIKSRQAQAARRTAHYRSQTTRQKLTTYFGSLQQTCLTVTQSALAAVSGLSLRTIKRYWLSLQEVGDKRSLSIYSPLSM